MKLIENGIRVVMLVSGVLTSTMAYVAIAPQAALTSYYGETLQGPLADVVVRSWGTLVTLVGLLLICGAYYSHVRRTALYFAGVSKFVFIGLVLSHGQRYLGQQVAVALAIDAVCVLIFASYLFATRNSAHPHSG